MVVFLDLDEDAVLDDPHIDPRNGPMAGQLSSARSPFIKKPSVINVSDGGKADTTGERPNPNLNATTRALGCYPIIIAIAHNIDLNTLHSLSRTCRQIRSSLLQYRSSLLQSTLHCSNETESAKSPSERPSSIPQWHFLGEGGHLVSGKVSVCARDLVSDCWRCKTIICRNCTIKSSQAPRLPSRHRRLCPTCLAAPLKLLTNGRDEACACPQEQHLCAPCGTKLVNADTTYRRVWTWRTRYTTYLGGLGTGIGEGNEGVKCARGRECLGAKDVEVEFECPSSSGSDGSDSASETARAGTPIARAGTPGTPDLEDKAGYWRQEVEGLGGVVKKKFRKRERVGRTVKEWEDEREGKGEILGREKQGLCRSWCGWCGRVVNKREEGDGKWPEEGDESRVIRIELRGVRGS